VVNLARLVGITVGVAVLGSAMASIGAQAALLIGGIVQLLGALVALRWAREEKVASSTRAVCHA
jgi:predicted MFS family arabinose efflux permease